MDGKVALEMIGGAPQRRCGRRTLLVSIYCFIVDYPSCCRSSTKSRIVRRCVAKYRMRAFFVMSLSLSLGSRCILRH